MAKITFVLTKVTFKVVMVTFVVTKITFVVDEITFKVAVILGSPLYKRNEGAHGSWKLWILPAIHFLYKKNDINIDKNRYKFLFSHYL